MVIYTWHSSWKSWGFRPCCILALHLRLAVMPLYRGLPAKAGSHPGNWRWWGVLYSWIGSGMVEDWCYNCRECSFHLYFFLLDPPFASYFWFFLFSIHCVERSLGVGSFLVPSQCSLEKKQHWNCGIISPL